MGSLSCLQINRATDAKRQSCFPSNPVCIYQPTCRGLQEHSCSTSHANLDPGAAQPLPHNTRLQPVSPRGPRLAAYQACCSCPVDPGNAAVIKPQYKDTDASPPPTDSSPAQFTLTNSRQAALGSAWLYTQSPERWQAPAAQILR